MRQYIIIVVLLMVSFEVFPQAPPPVSAGRPPATTAEELVGRDQRDYFSRCDRNPSASVLDGTDNTGGAGNAGGGAVRTRTERGQQ